MTSREGRGVGAEASGGERAAKEGERGSEGERWAEREALAAEALVTL